MAAEILIVDDEADIRDLVSRARPATAMMHWRRSSRAGRI
jgi:hypothetical protein